MTTPIDRLAELVAAVDRAKAERRIAYAEHMVLAEHMAYHAHEILAALQAAQAVAGVQAVTEGRTVNNRNETVEAMLYRERMESLCRALGVAMEGIK